MINLKQIAPVAALAIVAFSACNKNVGTITGIWEVDYTRSIHVAPMRTADLPNLCTNGGSIVITTNGSVDRHFNGNATKYQENVNLVQGNRNDNRDNFTSIEHYTDCNDFYVNVNNRSSFGSIFNNTSDGYAHVVPDSNNRCVLQVQQNRSHRYVRVDVGYLGHGTHQDAQGVVTDDTNNRLAGFTYDCEGGSYTSYLIHQVENGKEVTLSSVTGKEVK